jgi:hypothetical protein
MVRLARDGGITAPRRRSIRSTRLRVVRQILHSARHHARSQKLPRDEPRERWPESVLLTSRQDDGIVVARSGGRIVVDMEDVPAALQARLGADASRALLELLDRSHEEARDAMISACTERFERRLVEEVSTLRLQLAQVESGLRRDMAELGASLRGEMADLGASLRGEMADLRGSLRGEMADLRGSLRGEMADLRSSLREDIAAGRVELLKWSFLFWIGQVLAVGGMLGVVLRVMR